MLGMCTSVRENFSETKFFAIIQVDDVINRAKYFFNRFTPGVSGEGSNFAIISVKPWVAITTVVLPYNCDDIKLNYVT